MTKRLHGSEFLFQLGWVLRFSNLAMNINKPAKSYKSPDEYMNSAAQTLPI